MKEYKSIILNCDNIDTDIIIPKQFLKQTSKNNLGRYAFYEWRYDANSEKKDSILNHKANQGYNVLITRKNFGCGSSREHAAWALSDYGFEIIIAASFSDIFYRNWLNNHQLPITLDINDIDLILNYDHHDIKLNLRDKIITINNIDYEIKLSNKMHLRLLEKIDDIDYTLKHQDKIKEYENMQK